MGNQIQSGVNYLYHDRPDALEELNRKRRKAIDDRLATPTADNEDEFYSGTTFPRAERDATDSFDTILQNRSRFSDHPDGATRSSTEQLSFNDVDNERGISHPRSLKGRMAIDGSTDRIAHDSPDCATHPGLTESEIQDTQPEVYCYQFENLAFEGGGNKGLAYIGAVKVLEETGILSQVKRLAGTSAGAITAALLAIGCTSDDMLTYMGHNLKNIFIDHSWGYLSLLPNLINHFGWNPGRRVHDWFGDIFEEKTGKRDITFKEVQIRFDKELCIVVTNLSKLTEEYCHPKTTPDMPIRDAIRRSISIPFYFQAVRAMERDRENIFVDGGMLCNYPIHAFDGWWLSNEPENSFLNKLRPLDDIPGMMMNCDRFGERNDKTLGFVLYAAHESSVMMFRLESRLGLQGPTIPNTELGRSRSKAENVRINARKEHKRAVEAMDSFLKTLAKCQGTHDGSMIRKETIERVLNHSDFSKEDRNIIFGDGVSLDEAFDALDTKGNREITHEQLVNFIDESGIHIRERFLGYWQRDIPDIKTFMTTTKDALLTNMERIFVMEGDIKRTVGINTGHVGTMDFDLEPEDIECIIKQGEEATKAFLRDYVSRNNAMPREDGRDHGHDEPR